MLYWYFRISAKSLRGWKALYLWAQVIAVFPYFATDAASIVIVDRRPAARPWEVTLYMVSPPLHNKMRKVNDIQLWYNIDTSGKLVYIYIWQSPDNKMRNANNIHHQYYDGHYEGHTLYSVAQLSSHRKCPHICKTCNTAKIIKTMLFNQELAESGKK